MNSSFANTLAMVGALVFMVAAVLTWTTAMGSQRANALMHTGTVLMALGGISAFMIGRF